MTKKALITGITGQDGSYLAELLLEKGYEVHGLIRRSSTFNTERIDHIFDNLHLHFGDLTDGNNIDRVVSEISPTEIYNLGAQSHVRVSFDQPVYTIDTDAVGTLRILEAARKLDNGVKFYQACSSEMFGSSNPPQDEGTLFHPRSPYGCAKVYSYHQCINYREAYGMFIANGILFNHESPRRGETFVTRKITRAATRIKLGLQKKLSLGNLDSCRDWGFAGDYVEAMWMMLQAPSPADFVIATGVMHSVEEFLNRVFTYLDMDYRDYVETDPRYFRPSEVDALLGNSNKARKVLGWKPKVDFDSLVRMMVDHDMVRAKKELITVDIKG